jgi:cell division protein ZapA
MKSIHPEKGMIAVKVKVMGQEYPVTCPVEEHEALVASAEYLDERMMTARRRGKALGTERIAVMTALNLARELLALQGAGQVLPAAPAETLQRLQDLSNSIEAELQESQG